MALTLLGRTQSLGLVRVVCVCVCVCVCMIYSRAACCCAFRAALHTLTHSRSHCSGLPIFGEHSFYEWGAFTGSLSFNLKEQ
jgi:hypothetical protein